jgi:PBP1b-binding outer membrane lipoprotein LpoB
MRRRVAVLAAALLLGGCSGEPSFDERYRAADETIRETAAEIDAELAERERQASEAAALPSANASDQATSLMKAAK